MTKKQYREALMNYLKEFFIRPRHRLERQFWLIERVIYGGFTALLGIFQPFILMFMVGAILMTLAVIYMIARGR